MLSRTLPKVVKSVSYDQWSCPKCSFALTIVHSRQGTRVEYDLEAWARVCPFASRDTPLACPCVGNRVWAWLSPPENRAAVAAEAPAST